MKASRKELLFTGILIVVMSFVIATSNPKPRVIPALREWTSGFGQVRLRSTAQICVDPAHASELMGTALALREDLALISGLELPITCAGTPRMNGIILTLVDDDPQLGAEGYTIDSGVNISIRAGTPTGIFYGTRTILQILKQDEQHSHFPRGHIRDYPQWQVRGFMLDVGRLYYPMETLMDYVKFMGWYKMNEFHIHLNDNKIAPKSLEEYSAFRLVSTTFPGLEADDGAYTMDEWLQLEELASTYGVRLLPEIDSPAHALAFTAYKPELAYSADRPDLLDLKSPGTQEFMSSLWLEYLTRMNSASVHLGGDEYVSDEGELYVDYMNELNRLARSHGKNTRMWGSSSRIGGSAGLSREITLDIWKLSAYPPEQALTDGFDIVNVLGDNQYIVPLAGTYHDFLDTEWIYREWQPDYFSEKLATDPLAGPEILGGKFAVWNDRLGLGYSLTDVYLRVKPAMQAMSEKLWNPTLELGYLDYTELCQEIGNAPGTGLQAVPSGGSGNLALNQVVSVSSIVHGSPYFGENVVDGWTGTRWVSDDTSEAWLVIDLGGRQQIGQVNLTWDDPYALAYQLQSSTNGIIWKTILEKEQAGGGREEIGFSPVRARFVRLRLLRSSSTLGGYALQELEILAPLSRYQ